MIGSVTYEPPTNDMEATDGLTGTVNSLAYRIHKVERHLHSFGRFFESAAVPSGETHVADEIGSGGGAWRIDAGNDDWGAWVQVLGSSDTPAIVGNVRFDLHLIQVESTERNETYFIQIAFGASGAAGLAAGTYSDLPPFIPASNQIDSGPVTIQMQGTVAGTKAWARTKCPGQNTAWIDFYIGIHEYEG